MGELIGQLTVKVGIDEIVAGKTIGIILGFLRNEGPADKIQVLIDKMSGAEAAIEAPGSSGGLVQSMSGLMSGGLMGLVGRLIGPGLGTGENKSVAWELFKLGRDGIGADQTGEIIAGTSGLSKFA